MAPASPSPPGSAEPPRQSRLAHLEEALGSSSGTARVYPELTLSMLGDHLCEGQCPPSLGSDVDEKRAWAWVVERRGIGGFRRARGAARSQASPPQETRLSGAVAPPRRHVSALQACSPLQPHPSHRVPPSPRQ